MTPGKPSPLTPDDVLWLLNDGAPLDTSTLKILVVVARYTGSPPLKLGEVLLIDSRKEEVLGRIEEPRFFGKPKRRRRRTAYVPKDICWTTTDVKAARALSQVVQKPHEQGPYEWDGDEWRLINLAADGAGRDDPTVVRLKGSQY